MAGILRITLRGQPADEATRTFNPDFLAWVDDKRIVAIDTKGDHLIVEDAGRKLFYIEAVARGPKVCIRLVTEGHWSVVNGQR